jgi:hypothetical protein
MYHSDSVHERSDIMPGLTYIVQHGINLTEEWQVYVLIGIAVICLIALVTVIFRAKKW